MIILQQPRLSPPSQCAYLPEKRWRFQYFFAVDLSAHELDELLRRGWRKFGQYYFRPACSACRACVPLRILTREMKPSKSQRRVLRRCAEVEVRFSALRYRDEIFEIYREHSCDRFGRSSDEDEFISSFYLHSCPSLQSEYYLAGRLIAVGFLDVSSDGMSSAYFVYRTAWSDLRLGTYSVLKEAEYAASLGLRYYYLGYYVAECSRMAYKRLFHPHETYDWAADAWLREGDEV